ncbi:hypothetical protein PISMIDRAFT_677897 [Pisolithus microcarpus 441]|uniref:Uncharacterized protein n=1 Tax=Pisolithus microcarpus 441 TaxID=765257 RepID=A0A0C9ZFR9_9AGAM|nr:hypothetical protein PISMIDRAFT_677897 [Pisolithus microcarpus 441]
MDEYGGETYVPRPALKFPIRVIRLFAAYLRLFIAKYTKFIRKSCSSSEGGYSVGFFIRILELSLIGEQTMESALDS